MRALIVTDIQNDFLPGGALAVPRGDEVIPVVNALMERFELVVGTQDWHPPTHESFASQHPGRKPGDIIDLHGLQQVLWPDHCVQGSSGAELAPALSARHIRRIFKKGIDPRVDSYSSFFDNAHRRATGLGEYLQDQGVQEVYIVGLATDYCVKYTALDARALGFQTYVLEEGCRGIDLAPGDIERAIEEMAAGGVNVIGA